LAAVRQFHIVWLALSFQCLDEARSANRSARSAIRAQDSRRGRIAEAQRQRWREPAGSVTGKAGARTAPTIEKASARLL